MKLARRVEFFRQWATLARGGLTLSQSLAALQRIFKEPEAVILAETVENGTTLEQGFARAKFSVFEQRLVAAGENTGQLAGVLTALADFWQREHDLARSLRSTLAYPILLLHFVALTAPIPLLLENIGAYFLTAGFYLVGLYAIFFVARHFALRLWRSASGQQLLLRLPLFGSFWRSIYSERWVSITRLEFQAGLGLPEAVADAWRGTGYAQAEEWAEEARRKLGEGAALSEIFPTWRWLPHAWSGYLQAGETAGKLSDTLDFLWVESTQETLRCRRRLEEWLPRLFYYVVLLIVAAQVVIFYARYLGKVNGLIEGN